VIFYKEVKSSNNQAALPLYMMETESENESIFEMSEDDERNIKSLK